MSAPSEIEDGGQATVDDLIEVDLGIKGDFYPAFINACLSLEEQTQYLKFLRQNRDMFS